MSQRSGTSTSASSRWAFHPTQKPVELFIRPIEYHTEPGEIVYEPFSGSGTQIIAAERTGRVCYAVEQEPAYIDVAVARCGGVYRRHSHPPDNH